MKVVLIGGNSPSTPNLVKYLASCEPMEPLEIVLLARSEARLLHVVRAAKMLIDDHPIIVRSALLTDRRWVESLIGADIILLQPRVGGYAARSYFETFPLAHDICGDQDLGPGGMANAWASWPQLEHFFIEAATHSPNAMVLVLSSPVGLLVRLGLLSAPQLKIAGICEVPWTSLQEVCSIVNVFPRSVNFSYLGLHHFGWFYRIESGMRDLVSEYASAVQGRSSFPSAALIQQFSAIQTKYGQLHFESKQVIAEQKRKAGARSRYLEAYRTNALKIFECGGINEIKSILGYRRSPWYDGAVGPLVAAMGGVATSQPFFLSRRNNGTIAELLDDDVLELAYQVHEGQLRPFPISRPIPHRVISCIRGFVEAERLAAEAIWRVDTVLLKRALAVHPWTSGNPDVQAALAGEIITSSTVLSS